jgi:hypothetical protein
MSRKGWAIASGVANMLGDVAESAGKQSQQKALMNALTTGNYSELSNMGLDTKDVLDLMKTESTLANNKLSSEIKQNRLAMQPYELANKIQEYKDRSKAEILRNRLSKTKENLSVLPETGSNPVEVERLQKQGRGDREALLGISPVGRTPSFTIPKQPQEFTKPITNTVTTPKKTNLLDSVLGETTIPNMATAPAMTERSPYAEYPDAFQESGVWKVIRDGKKYRVQE